jgi:hypothetical protein
MGAPGRCACLLFKGKGEQQIELGSDRLLLQHGEGGGRKQRWTYVWSVRASMVSFMAMLGKPMNSCQAATTGGLSLRMIIHFV